ncbi:MAG: hypothetical protein QOE52_5737 [Mycobacterium sp.]|nr:hypothetical protein [Mycobacterium sp.]
MTAKGRYLVTKSTLTAALTLPALAVACAGVLGSPPARADTVAYLINVTVRPGYNFANADDALSYGHTICTDIGSGRSYDAVMGRIKSDFNNSDDYQASYLINQAVNELCPALIWQLRKSAANYRPPQS